MTATNVPTDITPAPSDIDATPTPAGSADEHCRVCGSSLGGVVVEDGEWKVRRCNGCGAGVMVPLPTTAELDAAYHSGLYSKEKGRVIVPIDAILNYFTERRLVFAGAGGPSAGRRADGTPKRLLDVGAGKGRLLRVARKKGFEVTGVEPHDERSEFGIDAYGVRVFQGPLEAFPVEEGPFDVITSWHVLEHVPDPVAFLKAIRPLLAEDGIFALEVPNLHSWAFRATGASWWQLSLPYHLEHFTPGSLTWACEQAGYRVESWSTLSMEHGPFTWLQSFVNRMTGEESILYRFLKRNWSPKTKDERTRLFKTLGWTALAVVLTPVWIGLSLLEARFAGGTVVRVRLRKN